MSDDTVSCPVFGCSIEDIDVLAEEPAFGGDADTDLKERKIRATGAAGTHLLSAFVCDSCGSIAGAETYRKYYADDRLGRLLDAAAVDEELHCPACGGNVVPETGGAYRNRMFHSIDAKIKPVVCPECDAIIGTARTSPDV